MPYLHQDDYVFSKDKDGNINAVGLNIDSYLMKEGEASMYIINSSQSDCALNKNPQVSDVLKGLAVPSGLFYLQYPHITSPVTHTDDSEISSNIMDGLLKLANEHHGTPPASKTLSKSKRKTRTKKPKSKKKSTRRSGSN